MRSKRVIAGRGVSGTYTIPEHREPYANDFGAGGGALRRETVSFGRKILKVHTNSVGRPVCPSGQIVKSVMPDSDP